MKFSTIQNFSFFSILAIISISFLYILHDFMFSIFFASTLAIIFYPMYEKSLIFFKNRKNIASAFSVFAILVLIMVPLFFISSSVVKETTNIYNEISSDSYKEKKDIFLNKYENEIKKTLEEYNLNYDDIKIKLIKTTEKTANYVATKSFSFGKDTISVFISFLLTLYIMFYLFRDGKSFLDKISLVMPLGSKNEEKIFKKFALIIKSIFKGSLIVALVQGVLGGLFFYFVGIKGVFLWTILMVILSIIPALGPTVILVPAALFMLMIGDNQSAYILFAGSFIISISDNILRPFFIGNSIKMHDLFLTLSILGGIGWFGILGFIIGPTIAGLFILFWDIFEEKYRAQLENDKY